MSDRETLYSIQPSPDSTLAIEVLKTGILRRQRKKHILFFEKFDGELSYTPDRPEASRVAITVDAHSVISRDEWLNVKKRQALMRYAKTEALRAEQYPQMRFSSSSIARKALRGYVVEGELELAGTARTLKVNVVLTPANQSRFQIDGDAAIRLSDFGIKPPASRFGLVRVEDQALIRILLWATPS